MKQLLLITYFIMLSVIVLAQGPDKIYHGCSTRNDPTSIGGQDGQRPVFDSCPRFIAGDLEKYLLTHTHYPKTAVDVSGRVFIMMIIEKNGSITNCKIVHGLAKEFDQEALRVVKAMPKWKPAILKGKPVRVEYVIPVNFTLTD